MPEPELSRHLEKRASLRRRHVSLLLPASFTVERQVEHDLLPVGEQVVQSIDLGPGVREAPAPAHHTMEVVVMLRVEGDRARRRSRPTSRCAWPRPGSRRPRNRAHRPGREPRPALLRPSTQRARPPRGRRRARAARAPAITRSTSISASVCAATPAPDSISTSSQTPKRSASNCSSRPGLAGAPQVEIEDARQLAGCRQRHQLAAILESTALNDPVKHLGWQSRDDVREVRRVQNAIEQTASAVCVQFRWSLIFSARAFRTRQAAGGPGFATATTTIDFRHRPQMIPTPRCNKQS